MSSIANDAEVTDKQPLQDITDPLPAMSSLVCEEGANENVTTYSSSTTTPAGIDVSESKPPASLSVNVERKEIFTTENFKVELQNLPKYYGYTELKKLLNNKLQLNARKIKVMTKGCNYTFINFDSDKDRSRAILKLNGYEWKKKQLAAIPAKPAQDPLLRKRKAEAEEDDRTFDSPNKIANCNVEKTTDILDISTKLKNAVLPLWAVPFEEQIETKTKVLSQFVKDLTKQLYKTNKEFLVVEPTGRKPFICDINPFIRSPCTTEYRNKCEFTIGYHPETNEPTVGFRLASYRDGCISVGPIDDTFYHLPKLMIHAAHQFQEYVRQSNLKPYDQINHGGTWRQLTVRTTLDDQLMMMVLINSDRSPDEIQTVKIDITNYFQSRSQLNITSFYLKEQEKPGIKIKNVPQLLFGEASINETLLGIKFRISPEAFFQINPRATEVMYNTIQELAQLDENTTLLDVYCGTGSIGLCLAASCGQVLGVEVISEAIDDAKFNAISNNLAHKCEFYAGKAEELLHILLTKVKCDKIVAVIDPPRAGVNLKVIQTLRQCERITSVVFAFCDAKAATKNFLDLGRPPSNTYKGAPFRLTAIFPIDLFPGTPHYELLTLFQRPAIQSVEVIK